MASNYAKRSKFQIDGQAVVTAGTASYRWTGPAANPSTLWTVSLLDWTDAYPLLTIMSMIGPSPDWFVGVSNLDLREDGI